MSAPPIIRVIAVTVSVESPQRITSGELRIGPHRHTLICDENGTLRQEFPNALEISPDAQITFHHKTSFLRRQKTQRIDTRRLFASFSAEPFEQIYRWLKMAFESYLIARLPTPPSQHLRLPKPCPIQSRLTRHYPLQPRLSSTIVRGKSDAVIPPLPLDVRFNPRFRILVIGKVRVYSPFPSHVLNSPSERRRKIKSYQYRLRDQQSGKSLSILFVISTFH
ncbi:hypothetical protein OG21DRAFT_218283 [Imleria badia]|nr:hypothetical protein OG21DRAFT_218283 [Imleria badia]